MEAKTIPPAAPAAPGSKTKASDGPRKFVVLNLDGDVIDEVGIFEAADARKARHAAVEQDDALAGKRLCAIPHATFERGIGKVGRRERVELVDE